MLLALSVIKTSSQVKAEKYRKVVSVSVMLLFFSGLITTQAVFALTLSGEETYYQNAGYAHSQQISRFKQAQLAFENQDYVYSARLLNSLAEKGHIQAQYLLAIHYDMGLGVNNSKNISFYWYKKAAKAGINAAQHNVAVAYAKGHGIEADIVKAVAWWKKAAKAGNTDSQFNLGIVYAAGRDSIKPNLKKALKWWRMAAINGDAVAQFNLGALYANGIGMSSRTCEASRWWKKSAENGFAQAEMALAVLQTKQDYAVCR